jgi:hypothetical protein
VVKVIAIGLPENKVTTVTSFRSLGMVHIVKCDVHMPRCKKHVGTTCTPERIAAPFDPCYTVANYTRLFVSNNGFLSAVNEDQDGKSYGAHLENVSSSLLAPRVNNVSLCILAFSPTMNILSIDVV